MMKRRLIGLATVAALVSFGRACPGADFNGDGTGDIAIFRPGAGLWAVRGVTRIYYGSWGDLPVPGDYRGDRAAAAAVFRVSSGLWGVRGVTRAYFGGGADQAQPGDYNGDGTSDFGIFRGSTGLWAARGVTRTYFGGSADLAIPPGQARGFGADLLETGQTASCFSGDDGTYRKGAAFSYQTLDPAGNGEIVTIDQATGLMWASDGNAEGCYFGVQADWNKAIDWAEGLTFAGFSDWRLPNFRELHSLVNYGTNSPAIDTVYFPNAQLWEHWSGSTSYWLPLTYAWMVDFTYGTMKIYNKTTALHVRAVRDGK